MFINFWKIFESVSNSHFKINEDTEKLKKLKEQWITDIVFFKKSWFFWLFKSWIIIVILLILVSNVFILWINYEGYAKYWIMAFLILNVLFSVFSFIKYLLAYRRIYSKNIYLTKSTFSSKLKNFLLFFIWRNEKHEISVIENINKVIQRLEQWDRVFYWFFNQAWLNKILFACLIVFIIYSFFSWNIEQPVYWVLNIILFSVQLLLIRVLLKNTENLEMDYYYSYNISWKNWWRFVIKDQRWLKWSTTTLKWEKVKEIKDNVRTNWWTFWNYWQIIVKTEWDSNLDSITAINYIWNVKEITTALEYMVFDYDENKLNHWNNILCELLFDNHIDITQTLINDTKIFKEEIENVMRVVKWNSDFLRIKFENWSEKDKREIREIYELCWFHK